MALLDLTLHVLGYPVHRYVARALDEGLHVPGPGPLHQLSHGVQLGELGGVVGVADGSWTQAVSQRQGHVVLGADVADVVKMLVEEALPIVCQAP